MSEIQVRHIKAFIEKQFSGIDMSDWTEKNSDDAQRAFLSRGVAALALVGAAGLQVDVATKAITDGYGDNGLDAVYYDSSERSLYLVQSKWDASGTGSIERGDVHKFLQGVRDLVHPRFDRFNAKINMKREEINMALDDSKTRCVLLIAYTGNQAIAREIQADIDLLVSTLNDTSDAAVHVTYSQKELHSALTTEGAAIDLEVMMYEWGKAAEPFTAFYGQVKAAEIASWWERHGVRLLALNLRNFIGLSEVNEAIIGTLIIVPEHFFYLNNGITVLCATVDKKLIGGGERMSGVFDCKGVSIVNGAQTVGSIAQAYAKAPDQVQKAKVAVRFVSLQGCPADFGAQITRAANTQNRIEARDFASLDPEQERLRVALQLEQGKQYIYKSGIDIVKADDGCTFDEAAVALACAYSDNLAVQSKREVSKLYENITKAPYKLLFNPRLSATRMWRSVLVLREVEASLKPMQTSDSGRKRLIAVHGNRFILHRVFRKLNAPLDSPDIDFTAELKKARDVIAGEVGSLENSIESLYPESYLAVLFKNADKCHTINERMDEVLPVNAQMELPMQ